MRAIFAYINRQHLFANILSIVLFGLGLTNFIGLARDRLPYIKTGNVIISTPFPGASPEEVELKVTNKIEQQLREVSGIERYVSTSVENLSTIQITGDPSKTETEVEELLEEIRDALRRTQNLPEQLPSQPNYLAFDTTVIPLAEIGVCGNNPIEEIVKVGNDLKRRLEDVPGVKRVGKWAWREREIHIEIIPELLRKHKLSIQEVVNAIRLRNIRGAGGNFESYINKQNIVTLAQFSSPLEVADVIVKSSFEGKIVKVNDVAQVREIYSESDTLARVNGRPGLLLQLFKERDADAIKMMEEVKKLLKAEAPALPPGVSFELSTDNSVMVEARFNVAFWNGVMGLLLVLFVLLIFLNWGVALWVSLSVPVVILGIFVFIPFFTLGVDTLIISSMILVLGIIVDDSIIVSEAIYRQFEKGRSAYDATVEGLCEVIAPLTTTILTTMVAFSPLFFLEGLMGSFMYVVPLTVCLALAVSWLEAIVILPSHLAHSLASLKNGPDSTRQLTFMRYLEYFYSGFLSRVIRYRYSLVGTFVLIFAFTLFYTSSRLVFEVFPTKDADQFKIKLSSHPGTSLEAMEEKVVSVEQIVLNLSPEERRSVLSRVGQKGGGEEIAELGNNYTTIDVSLTPFNERSRSAAEIIQSLRKPLEELGKFTDIQFDIVTGGPPVGKPFEIRVVSADEEKQKKAEQEVLEYLRTREGVSDIESSNRKGREQYTIKPNYEKLSRLGLTVSDVAQTVRLAYTGEEVTSVRYGNEEVEFKVIFSEASRSKADFLNELEIANNRGQLIKLKQVADFVPVTGTKSIQHYNGVRSVTLSARVDREILSPAMLATEVFEKLELEKKYPALDFVKGGEASEVDRSVFDLAWAFIIAILWIYLLLSLLFNSITQPLIVVFAIPFGIIGVLWAFLAHDAAFGFAAMMGVIGLSGVIVNDSIVLVDKLNKISRTGNLPDIYAVAVIGSAERLRPIIMTTLTTCIGLMPLAYGIGGADAFMGPMAISLGYGLLVGTFLTLLLVPCLYVIERDIAVWKKAK